MTDKSILVACAEFTMLWYTLRRILSALPVMLIVSLITFGLIRLIPGDPAQVIAGGEASVEQIAAIREALGLDLPWHVSLIRWLGGLLVGDLGNSLYLNISVIDAILARLPVTLQLTSYSLLITIPVGVAAGIVAAYWRGRSADLAVMGAALLGVSIPSFWIGIMSILLFAVHLGWVPAGGYVPFDQGWVDHFRAMVLPACILAMLQIGLLARITRSTMLDVLGQDYVRTARAKGASELRTMLRHALPNATVPIVTVVGLLFSLMIAGAVVLEQVFAMPGIGRLIVQAIMTRDYPLIQGTLLLVAAAFVLINVIVDIVYAMVDPRIRLA